MHLPSAVGKETEIDAAVAEVAAVLSPDVVHIRYEIDENWSGDWAIHLRVQIQNRLTSRKNFNK
jgi:hypothetical protein